MKSPLKSQMFCGAKWAAEYDALFDRLCEAGDDLSDADLIDDQGSSATQSEAPPAQWNQGRNSSMISRARA
jgi:hypothetical protein